MKTFMKVFMKLKNVLYLFIMTYTKGQLQSMAEHYHDLKGWNMIDEKINFDLALRSIGKGEWLGLTTGNLNDYWRFKRFSHFGKLQQIIIASILGIPDNELRIKRIPQLRGLAYYRMTEWLNE